MVLASQKAKRIRLHEILVAIPGVKKAYFQPTTNTKLEYPCVIYKKDTGDTTFADNAPYRFEQRYLVTCLDTDPDSPIAEELSKLPKCTFDRTYPADNLNHTVFNLYF